MKRVGNSDLDEMLARGEDLHRALAGTRVLMTGGTGFFGRWMLESWVDASDRLDLSRTLVVVTRDPVGFADDAPHLARHRSVQLVRGDVLGSKPIGGSFDAGIHAATAARLALIEDEPDLMYRTIVDGTANVIEWVSASGRIPMLFTSSGAVYGEQRPEIANITEECPFESPSELSVYARGKRDAEGLFDDPGGPEARVARCFAFGGPLLPLDAHFAIGNFIRDGVAGRTIEVKGDGTPVRSYMYPTDLVVWLWTILLRGEPRRPYNVGSERGIELGELAKMVGQRCGVDVAVRSEPVNRGPSHRYVPSTERARSELGLNCDVSLEDLVDRTIASASGG